MAFLVPRTVSLESFMNWIMSAKKDDLRKDDFFELILLYRLLIFEIRIFEFQQIQIFESYLDVVSPPTIITQTISFPFTRPGHRLSFAVARFLPPSFYPRGPLRLVSFRPLLSLPR